MTNTVVKSKLVETLTEKVIEQIALNTPDYECEKQRTAGILDNIYNSTLSSILTYSEKIEEFTKKLKESSMPDGSREAHQKAIGLLDTMITNEFLDNNENSLKRYKGTNNIFECFQYFEYPLSVLDINSNNKDYQYSVFGIMALDISSFQNNKKYTWDKIKNNPVLSKKFLELYGALSENENDLYFDCFKQSDNIEDKIALVKEHFKLTHMGMGETKKCVDSGSFVLYGSIREDSVAMDYRENPDKVSEILELDI